jgi:hypothetical protein
LLFSAWIRQVEVFGQSFGQILHATIHRMRETDLSDCNIAASNQL